MNLRKLKRRGHNNDSALYIVEGVAHHLMDFVEPERDYSLADFKVDAIEVIDDILNRGKLPILVGGTGLYFWAVIDNLDIPKVEPDKKLRKELEEKSLSKLVEMLREKDPDTKPLLRLYKEQKDDMVEDDRRFVRDLFYKTIKHHEEYEKMISGKTKNWEMDRIASMDILLMEMAVCEFLEFPTIPVKVTLNEYIDIAKAYSTPKSKVFINGVLDKIILSLKDKGELHKSGRGLID